MIPQLSIILPPSKSLYNRLFVMARLARLSIPSLWRQIDLREDLAVMLHASGGNEGRISVGVSDTVIRPLAALFALTTEREVLLASPVRRMTERPLAQLITLLSQLGAGLVQPSSQEPAEDLYPLVRTRPMNPQQKGLFPTLTLPSGLESSQTITTLLPIAPCLPHGLALRWQDDQLPSASYIQLTCSLVRACGIDLSVDRHGIYVAPGTYCEVMFTHLLSHPIDGWSSAQYPLQWALMTPRPCQLFLTNAPALSLQPGAHTLELLQISPEWLSADDDTLCFDSEFLQKHLRKLTFGSISLSNNPDFASTLIAFLLYYQKKAQLRGLDHLRLKESDRIVLILRNGEQLDYQLSYETESGFCLAGSTPSSIHTPAPIATDASHRMVVAWVPFAQYHQLQIETPQVVDKSYPTFWRDLRKFCEIITTPLYIRARILFTMTLDTLNLSPELLRATTGLGFSEPMSVQQEVIPHLSTHRGDLIALSKTGSGKTVAYGLSLLERITQAEGPAPCGLILTPTREFAIQVQSDLVALVKYTSVRQILALYGGTPVEEQIRQFAKGYHIIVATPGRLCDLIRRKAVKLRKVSVVVLGEADVMPDTGFQRSLQEILQVAPQQVEHWLFSAMTSRKVREITDNYISDAHKVQIGTLNKVNADIKHLYVVVPARHKYTVLRHVVDYYPNIYGTIFCRTCAETKEIARWLIRDGYNADALHGDFSQAQRDMVMNRFRIRNLQLLVATDVAARGFNVDDVIHVLHYGLSADPDSYTHRSGRIVRASKMGLSIAICHLRDSKQVRIIEQHTGIRIESMPLPSGQEICKKQLFALATRIEYADSNEHGTQHDELLNVIVQKLAWLPPEEIIRRVLMLEADRIMRYYTNTPDLSAQELTTEEPKYRTEGSPEEHRKAPKKRSRADLPPMTSLRIDLGKHDKLYPNRLLELINRTFPYKITIGKIDLSPSYSYFEIAGEWAETVAAALSEEEYNGCPIRVTIQKDRQKS